MPLCPPGVLMIDDYGHLEVCKRAVCEYFCVYEASLLICTVRIGLKV